MKNSVQKVRNIVRSIAPEFEGRFKEALLNSSEAILIGSYATGRIGKNSDLDLIFVGQGRRFKGRNVDVVWVSPERLRSRNWLGSELATHAAHYGVWFKGKGLWKKSVFFSDLAVRHKCERVLVRLTKIYLKRHSLSVQSQIRLISRCVLDMQRTVLLSRRKAVPPATEIVSIFLTEPTAMFEDVCSDALLGDLGKFFVEHFIPTEKIVQYLRGFLTGRRQVAF